MIPRHIGFIMDGNGRWARKQGMERSQGHYAGAAIAESVVRLCADLGIRFVTLFAFSAENWGRPEEEVRLLFRILLQYLKDRSDEMIEKGVRIRFTGQKSELPESVTETMETIEKKSINQDHLDMIIAVNYGGRQEIWDAVIKACRYYKDRDFDGIEQESSEGFRRFLYHPDVPDPDLIIRTSGEQRISNFLLWQMAYSELYFTPILWPEFGEAHLKEALESYASRHRRFGGVEDYGTSFQKRDHS